MAVIAPEELARALDEQGHASASTIRVVDTRWYLLRPGDGRRAYDAGHLPGAIFVDLDTDLSAPAGPGRHPLPDPSVVAARLGALGIGDEHRVVAYDDAGGTVAARLWWMLDALGHRAVEVLDGGIQVWEAAGLPLSIEPPAWPPARLTLAASWPRTIDREALAARLGSLVLLDARAGERYRGEVEPIDPAAGHIPTALSAPAAGNLGPDGRFLAPEVLRARFKGLGVGATGAAAAPEVVVSCGSGTTACHHALAMRVAGLSDPLLYPGSFSDWSRAGMPIASGVEPGSARAGSPASSGSEGT